MVAFDADIHGFPFEWCGEKSIQKEVTSTEDEVDETQDDATGDEPQVAVADTLTIEPKRKEDTRVIHCGQTAVSYKSFRVACDMPLDDLKYFMYEQTGVPPDQQEHLTSGRDVSGIRFATRRLNPEDCRDLYMERYLQVKYCETSRFPPFEQEGHNSFYIIETATIKSVKKKILEQKGLWDFTEDRIKRMPDGKTPSGKDITEETKVHDLAFWVENVFSHYRDYRFVLVVESPDGKVL